MINDIKLPRPMPTYVVMIILALIIIFTFGGYALYFKSKSKLNQVERDCEIIKEKSMHAEENYNELQKKFNSKSDELKQVSKDYETTLQKQQECKEKQEELQSKFEIMVQTNERIRKDLDEARTKLGIKPDESDAGHPVQLLNKENGEKSPSTPATGDQPKANEKANKTSSYRCPTPDIVTAQVTKGEWQQDKIRWWVDFSRRPLNENESVKNLFKILYDGQAVACYYMLGTDENTWLVVKGDNKDKKPLTMSKEGWEPCPTDECKSLCNKENLDKCQFALPE